MKKGLVLLAPFLFSFKVLAAPEFLPAESVPEDLLGFESSSVPGSDHFRVEFTDLGLKEVQGGTFAFDTKSVMLSLSDSKSELPVFRRSYPAGMKLTVHLTNPKIEETNEPVPLWKSQPLEIWGVGSDLPGITENNLFPGKWYEIQPHQKGVEVLIFPAQHDARTGKLFILRSADVFVESEEPPKENPIRANDTVSVILTTESHAEGAKLLKDLHETSLGVTTEIIFAEDIERQGIEASSDELPLGFTESDNSILKYDPATGKGFNVTRAKKIAHFLQDRIRRRFAFRYLTILGDATQIPPSGYISLKEALRTLAVTDQCYASLNHCLDPVVSVGRLPFSDDNQIQNYVNKVSRYLENMKLLHPELALFGGQKNKLSDIYLGEEGALQVLSPRGSDFRDVRKFFATEGNFNHQTVLDMMAGKENSEFAYVLDHGTGNELWVGDETVSSLEVEALRGENLSPIVVAIACKNGAFDNALMAKSIFDNTRKGTDSVGISLLKNPSASVAYLGSTRDVFGNVPYRIDEKGNVEIQGTTFSIQLLNQFFEKYRLEQGRLGDAFLGATESFLFGKGNSLNDDKILWTYFNTVLLGDPALPLTDHIGGNFGFDPAESLYSVSRKGTTGLPILPMTLVPFPLNTFGPVVARVIRTDGGSVQNISTQSVSGSNVPVNVGPLPKGRYLLKMENQTGVARERHVWFDVVN